MFILGSPQKCNPYIDLRALNLCGFKTKMRLSSHQAEGVSFSYWY